jgi:hypothetical protein
LRDDFFRIYQFGTCVVGIFGQNQKLLLVGGGHAAIARHFRSTRGAQEISEAVWFPLLRG